MNRKKKNLPRRGKDVKSCELGIHDRGNSEKTKRQKQVEGKRNTRRINVKKKKKVKAPRVVV